MTVRAPLAVAAACLGAALVATALGRIAADPSADVRRGTEEAFARGLQRRELPPGRGPQRWTTGEATFTFRGLPGGTVGLEVEATGHRSAVAVVADGVVVGTLAPGATSGSFVLPSTGRATRTIALRTDPFRAGDGRDLGTMLGRVTLRPLEHPWWPGSGAMVLFLVPAAVVVLGGLLAGLPAVAAVLAAVVVAILEALALAPSGLVHSPYATRLAGLVVLGTLLAAVFARAVRGVKVADGREIGPAGPAAFLALSIAFGIHVVAGTSPMAVASDAVFHANKLVAVAGGDPFPVSVTQHARPFRFPYGVSFYAVLAPLARAGLDPVMLVRTGAAAFGLAASAALFVLVLAHAGPRAAFAAIALLSLMPGTFDVAYSYGNFSNAFGQSATVLFFAWWVAAGPGGWALGALLVALAALAHFSSLVFLVALAGALVLARGGDVGRRRALALCLGLGTAGLYYLHFWPLVVSQLPRLLEGGGQGRGASRTAWDAARLQVVTAAGEWGLPAVVLALAGRPRAGEGGFRRDLAAFALGGLALALPAIVSPLEVRYVYGLTALVAVAGGIGFARLAARGRLSALAAGSLLLAEAVLGAANVLDALRHRYRP